MPSGPPADLGPTSPRHYVRCISVRILVQPDMAQTIGTGVVLSATGLIATCAHVVQDAGFDPKTGSRLARASRFNSKNKRPREGEPAVLWVSFSSGQSTIKAPCEARVVPTPDLQDDDIALLQIVDLPTPLPPSLIAILGSPTDSGGMDFTAYGYRRLGHYLGGYARGIIHGLVDRPPTLSLAVDPLQLESTGIAPGMSGSPVLDEKHNRVVGLVSERYATKDHSDRDTAWAVSMDVLKHIGHGHLVLDATVPWPNGPAWVDVRTSELPRANSGRARNMLRSLVTQATQRGTEAAKHASAANLVQLLLSPQLGVRGEPGTRAMRKELIIALRKLTGDSIKPLFQAGDLEGEDLVGMDFSGLDLSGVSFREAFLIGTNFAGADLCGADFTGSWIRNVRFEGARLDGTNLTGADWFNAIGLSVQQLRSAFGQLLACPANETGFQRVLKNRYVYKFSSWSTQVQEELRAAWRVYQALRFQ